MHTSVWFFGNFFFEFFISINCFYQIHRQNAKPSIPTQLAQFRIYFGIGHINLLSNVRGRHNRLLCRLGAFNLHSNPVWLYREYILWSIWVSFVDTAIRNCFFRNLIRSAPAVQSSVPELLRKYSSISSQLRFRKVAFLFLVFNMSV